MACLNGSLSRWVVLGLTQQHVFFLPVRAFADGTLQLKPMMQDTVYNSNSGGNQGSSSYYGGFDNLSSNNYGSAGYSDNSSMTLHGHVASIPKGTLLTVQTDFPVNSSGMRVGDPVNATLANDIFVNDTWLGFQAAAWCWVKSLLWTVRATWDVMAV